MTLNVRRCKLCRLGMSDEVKDWPKLGRNFPPRFSRRAWRPYFRRKKLLFQGRETGVSEAWSWFDRGMKNNRNYLGQRHYSKIMRNIKDGIQGLRQCRNHVYQIIFIINGNLPRLWSDKKKAGKNLKKCKINDKNPCAIIKALMPETCLIESNLGLNLSLKSIHYLKVRKSLGKGQK